MQPRRSSPSPTGTRSSGNGVCRSPCPRPASGALMHETQGSVESFDGTALATHHLGDTTSPPLVLVPAVGSNLAPWRRMIPRLLEQRHLVTWDLRGLHASGPPATDHRDAGASAEDAVAVMDDAGIDAAPVIAWSTGGRIAIELAHRYPERVTSLILVCGMNGYPLSRLLRNFDLPVVLPTLAGIGKHFPVLFGKALDGLSARPELAGIVRQSGLLAPTADVAAFVDMLKGTAECDPKAFLTAYEMIAGDPSPEALEGIEAPTMLILGSRDRFTSRGLSEQIASALPGSVIHEYEGATHFLPLEFPARLAGDITAFLATLPSPTAQEAP
ncbi:MAG: alpha/beta fold hydrolase [Actinobacteria bacterium]|nr:alpha/beta fold hydrolase [Actinomycetota bacterium]